MARARRYDFDVPVVIGNFKAAFVPGYLKNDGLWDHIPKHIQDKFLNMGWSDVTITKEDLDSIDDQTWKKIKAEIAKMA